MNYLCNIDQSIMHEKKFYSMIYYIKRL